MGLWSYRSRESPYDRLSYMRWYLCGTILVFKRDQYGFPHTPPHIQIIPRQHMKIFLFILGAGLLFSACSKDPEAAPADAKGAIAGDKAQVLEILMLADTKGTAAEAFMDAAQDSSLAAKMRLALGLTAEAPKAGSKSYTSKTRATSKDGLDKASDALDNANQKLEKTEKVVDKTGQVLDKAGEIKKKTGDIFK